MDCKIENRRKMCQGHSPRDKLVFNKLQNFQKIGFGEIYGLNLSE